MKVLETLVGMFIVIAGISLFALAFKVSGLTTLGKQESYSVSADFDNIGNLKPRAAVTIAGVKIGQVTSIILNQQSFKAVVNMRIDAGENNIPVDSQASIVTAGLLGANYVSVTPGFDDQYLKEGSQIEDTHPAILLEEMIGQLMFSMKNDSNEPEATNTKKE